MGGVQYIVIIVSVFLSADSYISETTRPNITTL